MRPRWTMAGVLLGSVWMALAGCSGLGAAPVDPLDGTSWILRSLEETGPLPGVELTAAFEDGLVYGSSGCNSYGASYSVSRDRISVREMQSTLMACALPEGAMDQEQRFVTLLSSSDRYELSDGQLRLLRSDQVLLVFVPQG